MIPIEISTWGHFFHDIQSISGNNSTCLSAKKSLLPLGWLRVSLWPPMRVSDPRMDAIGAVQGWPEGVSINIYGDIRKVKWNPIMEDFRSRFDYTFVIAVAKVFALWHCINVFYMRSKLIKHFPIGRLGLVCICIEWWLSTNQHALLRSLSDVKIDIAHR